jgi:5-(carboxyamino)imidazole ribonucleotide synthase
MRAPAAVMVNLLGQRHGPARPAGVSQALLEPGAHLHLYHKRDVRPGRKMGHITALGDSVVEAEAIALRAAARVEL